MFYRTLFCIAVLVSSTNCTYQYIRNPATLRNAYSFCRKNDGSLASYGDDLKREMQNWNSAENTTIWTGNFRVLSPWISLAGCYRYTSRPDPNRTFMFLANTSAAACGIYCSKYNSHYFALQGKQCLCVTPSDVLSRTGEDACELRCDGSPLSEPCGSIDMQTWSLYSKVTFGRDTTNTSDHCIAGKCNRSGGYTLYGSNCSATYKGVCSNGIQPEHESNWTSSLQTCMSREGVNLVTNMTGVCRTMHHYSWTKFWIGQFRGVAQHIGPDIPDTHIVGCTLVTIATNSRNKTSRTFHSKGCEIELRPYICKLNNDGMETSLTSGTERTTITYDNKTSTPKTQLSTTAGTASNSTDNRTISSSSSLPNKDSPISGGTVAAVVITVVLGVFAVTSILFLWRREMLCFKKLRIGQNIANRTYDTTFSNNPDHQGDGADHDSNYDEVDVHTSGPCDDVVEDPFATTDDVYAHPTFDYRVADDGDENKQNSYLEMGASLPPQNDTTAAVIDEEYVYMGDDVSNKSDNNEDEDMYYYIKP